MNFRTLRSAGLLAILFAPSIQAQDETGLELRLSSLERENRELEERLLQVASEIERFQLRDVEPAAEGSEWGLGPAASKVYGREQGLSIGGYGEILFQERAGMEDVLDALRVVTYFGYKFDENWVFNSEIELEHATTGSASGTTDSAGEASVEFAYLDWLHEPGFNLRGGLVLVPMGLVNENHEPVAFLPAARPLTEQRILPTTWREIGLGAFGDAGGFGYRAYVINGFEGSRFDESGLRGGRQKGSRAAADDFAFVGRLDWLDTPGLVAGGSVYFGDSGQGEDLPGLGTAIAELHVDFEHGPWTVRALGAMADIDDAAEFNDATGENLAEGLEGWYVELGFDVLSWLDADSEQALSPYVRWESIDTQADMPSGFSAAPGQEEDVLSFGVAYQPISQVIVKLGYEDHEDEGDQALLLLGYVF